MIGSTRRACIGRSFIKPAGLSLKGYCAIVVQTLQGWRAFFLGCDAKRKSAGNCIESYGEGISPTGSKNGTETPSCCQVVPPRARSRRQLATQAHAFTAKPCQRVPFRLTDASSVVPGRAVPCLIMPPGGKTNIIARSGSEESLPSSLPLRAMMPNAARHFAEGNINWKQVPQPSPPHLQVFPTFAGSSEQSGTVHTLGTERESRLTIAL